MFFTYAFELTESSLSGGGILPIELLVLASDPSADLSTASGNKY